ncbi:hypothetical protein LTR24_008321 [Lithohypha guttulata]|uniref:Uncharacterized protein n=1 Tax=Lithohypha guttulata TaxID=1690604 RepID=A0ABR0K111_9EURO|nr:hypothetical protein LTR24_008321 [Lithohypha guttulata]
MVCVSDSTQDEDMLFSLRSILFGWVNQVSGPSYLDRLVRWEVIPVHSDGLVTIRVQNGRIDRKGELIDVTLGYWNVDADRNGICAVLERSREMFAFKLAELAVDTKGTLIHLKDWDVTPRKTK